MESQRAVIDTFVIDHVEKPGETQAALAADAVFA